MNALGEVMPKRKWRRRKRGRRKRVRVKESNREERRGGGRGLTNDLLAYNPFVCQDFQNIISDQVEKQRSIAFVLEICCLQREPQQK